MNVAKNKHCVFESAGGCSGSLVSLVFIVSTVGVTPRKQKASKSVVCCIGHTAAWAALQGENLARPMLGTLDALCAEKASVNKALGEGNGAASEIEKPLVELFSNPAYRSPATAVVDATAAALAMNHRRWHVLKKR